MARPFLVLCLFALALLATDEASSALPAWSYVLQVDHGIRVDRGGRGHFMASRYHGRHNGIDLLAPIGTPVVAVCSGKARSGVRGGFGRWVQLVCKLPQRYAEGGTVYVSVFHAHLHETLVPADRWVPVASGKKLGTVGKSGNAKGAEIAPQLHLEVIAHDSQKRASAERHSGRNQANTKAADRLVAGLKKHCLEPTSFKSRAALRRARRVDPFMFLSCLTVDKPELTKPQEAKLAKSSRKWSSHYTAETFDVDVGRRESE